MSFKPVGVHPPKESTHIKSVFILKHNLNYRRIETLPHSEYGTYTNEAHPRDPSYQVAHLPFGEEHLSKHRSLAVSICAVFVLIDLGMTTCPTLRGSPCEANCPLDTALILS
jgi:hypothetical protein